MRLCVLALLFAVGVLTGSAVKPVLADPPFVQGTVEYEDLRDVTLEIQRRYPPDRFLVIGLGRSPAPIVTVLNILQPGSASSLPLSGFRYSQTRANRERLTPQQIARLHQQFERFVPSVQELRGREIVLIDYSPRFGTSLSSGGEYLNAFLRTHRAGVHDARTLIMRPKFYSSDPVPAGVDRSLEVEQGLFANRLVRQEYDRASLHGTALVDDLPTPLDPPLTVSYEAMRLQLAESVSADSSLALSVREQARQQRSHRLSVSLLSEWLGLGIADALDVLRLSWSQAESRQALREMFEFIHAHPGGDSRVSMPMLELLAQNSIQDEATLALFVDWAQSPRCLEAGYPNLQETAQRALQYQLQSQVATARPALRTRLENVSSRLGVVLSASTPCSTRVIKNVVGEVRGQ